MSLLLGLSGLLYWTWFIVRNVRADRQNKINMPRIDCDYIDCNIVGKYGVDVMNSIVFRFQARNGRGAERDARDFLFVTALVFLVLLGLVSVVDMGSQTFQATL